MKIALAAHVKGVFLYGNRSLTSYLMDGYKYYYIESEINDQNTKEAEHIIKAIRR